MSMGLVGNRVNMRWDPASDTANLKQYNLNVVSSDGVDRFEYVIPPTATSFEVGDLDYQKTYNFTFTPVTNEGPGQPNSFNIQPVEPLFIPAVDTEGPVATGKQTANHILDSHDVRYVYFQINYIYLE